jgi:bifunctional DNase/RNase
MINKKKIDLSEVDDSLNLELLPVEIDHIVVNPDKRVYVVLANEDRQNGVELNPFEASHLSFVHKGLHKNSHIQTMHQLYVKTLDQIKTKIENVVIESKVGDVIYCSIKLVDSNYNRFFTIVSLADGLILAKIAESPIHVIGNVWEDMDPIDEWDYEDYILDFEDDDDDDIQ